DRSHGRPTSFQSAASAGVLCEVYEALDPGCCVVAESEATSRLMGVLFYRERQTHVALGVLAVHPNYFAMGVAKSLVTFVIDYAEALDKPIRLISNAANLDSYSLYTRVGFVPRSFYQGVTIAVPDQGLAGSAQPNAVRNAQVDDVEA